jgi:hypothetical protein
MKYKEISVNGIKVHVPLNALERLKYCAGYGSYWTRIKHVVAILWSVL